MIGVSAGRLRAYLRAGVLSPEKRRRAASCASRSRICCCCAPPRGWSGRASRPAACARALKKLRARLPDGAPLTGVQLGTEGPRWSCTKGARAGRRIRARCCWRSSGRAPSTETPMAAAPRSAARPADAAGAGRPDRRAAVGRGDLRASAATWTKPIPSTPRPSYRAGDRAMRRSTRTRTSTSGRILHERGDLPGRREALPRRAGDPPHRRDRALQPGRRARGPGTARRGAGGLPAARSPPTPATPTRTTTRPGSSICWATTTPRSATSASAASSHAGTCRTLTAACRQARPLTGRQSRA